MIGASNKLIAGWLSNTFHTHTHLFPLTDTMNDVDVSGEREYWDMIRQRHFVQYGLKNATTQELKLVSEIEGIDKAAELKLAEAGILHACQLIGQYMVNSMDNEITDYWLEHTIMIKRPDLREVIINTMQKWCDRHL